MQRLWKNRLAFTKPKVSFSSRDYRTDNYVYGYRPNREAPVGLEDDKENWNQLRWKIPRIWDLIQQYRHEGHRFSDGLDPLKSFRRNLSTPDWKTNIEHLESEFATIGTDVQCQLLHGHNSCESFVNHLSALYTGDTTAEFMHLPNTAEKEWFTRAFETRFERYPVTKDEQLRIARLLLKGQLFDRFLANKFVTVKRYSGEGAESLLVAVDAVIRKASGQGIEAVVVSMPHRGRNNLLTALLDYSPRLYFRKMKGMSEFKAGTMVTGDTFSHYFISKDIHPEPFEEHKGDSRSMHISLIPNPSHLEANLPVGLGKTRAKMRTLKDGDYDEQNSSARNGDKTLYLQIHGDGSVVGQGIVAETLAMSGVPNYDVGGSIHIIVNNQVSYTTQWERSSGFQYSSDVSKPLSCPVLHVNGDNPESVSRALRLAVDYRNEFRRDVFINLICYRKWGHNELDDPTLTQPKMYAEVAKHIAPPDAYLESIKQQGFDETVIKANILEPVNQWNEKLSTDLKTIEEPINELDTFKGVWQGFDPETSKIADGLHVYNTGLDYDTLRKIGSVSVSLPSESFQVHPTVQRTFIDRRKYVFDQGTPVTEKCIDWACGEALAFGSLLKSGFPVRISGQDVGRGTFSQRHAMFVDQKTDAMWIPFNSVPQSEGWARFEVANSPLSEASVCGFELGMSADNPNQLVIWELQFGDFFTGAQIQLDTYIGSMETKWYQQNGLVVNLPHGYDGVGPEHSSCRLERWLQTTDSLEAPSGDRLDGKPIHVDTDMISIHIAAPTTPAQYFHLLRRQITRPFRRPLVLVGPKILLRHPAAQSALGEFGPGTHFHHVLGPEVFDATIKPNQIKTIILCSGKHFYELESYRAQKCEQGKAEQIAIIRIEQLTPFPILEIVEQLRRFPNANRFIWSQEEHRNMGAWNFVSTRLRNFIGLDLEYAGRCELACPAVGIGSMHKAEAEQVLLKTFAN